MDYRQLIPENQISGEDDQETAELAQMLQETKQYIMSFPWCPPISEVFLGMGIGGVLAVFLVRFKTSIKGESDDSLWIIIGDLPSAYLVCDNAQTPQQALGIYCDLMDEWIDAVRVGAPLDNIFPVDAPAVKEYANKLAIRLAFIRDKILPRYNSPDT